MPATRQCHECKEVINDQTGRRLFCGKSCRNAFMNRRRDRGAQLYDLFMPIRYERGLARRLNLWTKICRMAAIFKDEDDRAGRKSWPDPRRTLRDRADLGAKILVKK